MQKLGGRIALLRQIISPFTILEMSNHLRRLDVVINQRFFRTFYFSQIIYFWKAH